MSKSRGSDAAFDDQAAAEFGDPNSDRGNKNPQQCLEHHWHAVA
jgi:hypothetical protein